VLERQVTREVRVRLQRAGEPAPGYDVGQERLAFTTATVTGPASAVERVSELIANVSVANLKSNFNQAVTLQPVDSEGQSVTEARPSPLTVQVQVPITQKEGFRDVAVKLVYRGQVAPGYRLDSYIVSPPIVTVSSSDRDLVSALPGFVETEPIDIAGATDDITQQLALVLPQGVFPVGEPAVLVQFIVEPITDTVSVQRLVEVQNLGPGLIARVLPETVEVLVTGPLPVLRRLTGEDVRIVVNVQNLTAGRYQLTPEVLFSRESLRADTIQPGTIEVELVRGTPPTRTPTRAPLPTRTATPITTPTFTPAPPADTETPTPTPGQ
jgi:YbbR domain-containing protein